MMIQFLDLKNINLRHKNSLLNAFAEVLDSGWFILGESVKRFEKEFADYCGVQHCVGVANGLDALILILEGYKQLGFMNNGDEVIVPSNTYIASILAVSKAGLKPVLVEPNMNTYLIDENLIEDKITSRTKAILPVHLYGRLCNMEAINAIAKKHHLKVIEDCAQSHFSEFNGRRVGLIGIAGSFSFYPGKNLGAYGDAGCIITNDDEMAARFRMYANHGALIKHKHEMEGINSRMDGLQAAILSAKLPFILKWTEQRIKNAALYNKHLDGIAQIRPPKVRPNSKHTYHLYVIKAQRRDELMTYLKEKGIETAIHYPTPLPNLPAYAYLGTKPSDFPVATALQEQILSLPMYPELEEKQIEYIAQTIRTFYHS